MRSLEYLLALIVCTSACERAGSHDVRPTPRPTPTKDPLEAVADEIAAKKRADDEMVGATVGVARRGKVVFMKGYGHADREAGVQATADTVYPIHEVTEQFTAAAVLRLVEMHKLALADDITRYVKIPTGGRTVTIEQLLRHSSGMPELSMEEQGPLTPMQILERVASNEWSDDSWGSDAEYLALGLAIEKVSGEPYAQFLEREVIARAHLTHTAPCEATKGAIAQKYRVALAGPPVVAKPAEPALEFANGSLCSTVPDLLAWSSALSSGQVVSASSYKMMTTTSGSMKGLGLVVNEKYEHRHVDGGTLGSELSEYPDDGLTIVVVANTNFTASSRIERALAMAALGVPSKEVPLPPEVRDSLVADYQFEDGGHTTVARWHRNLSITVAAGAPFELEYQGNDTFAAYDSGFTVVFHRDKGAVTGLTAYQPPEMGGEISAVRVLH